MEDMMLMGFISQKRKNEGTGIHNYSASVSLKQAMHTYILSTGLKIGVAYDMAVYEFLVRRGIKVEFTGGLMAEQVRNPKRYLKQCKKCMLVTGVDDGDEFKCKHCGATEGAGELEASIAVGRFANEAEQRSALLKAEEIEEEF